MRSALTLIGLAALLLFGCSGGPTCPSSCTGCCDSSGACQDGTRAEACGLGASRCVQCGGGDLCSPARGVCAPCGPSSCAGCCTGDHRCVVELRERDSNCGVNGSACLDCAATGKTCSSSGLSCQ